MKAKTKQMTELEQDYLEFSDEAKIDIKTQTKIAKIDPVPEIFDLEQCRPKGSTKTSSRDSGISTEEKFETETEMNETSRQVITSTQAALFLTLLLANIGENSPEAESNEQVSDVQLQTGKIETEPMTKSIQLENESKDRKNLGRIVNIVSSIGVVALFIYFWAFLPQPSTNYVKENQKLNGIESNSPNFTGFGERESLLCDRNLTI